MLHVTATGGHRVELRDPSGRLLWARDGRDAADYDLSRAGVETSGLRILTVSASGERFTRILMP
jgi:hypothetical protein